MKRVFTILIISISFKALSQKVVVSNPKENVIYFGIPNPIDVAVEGRYCKDLAVSVHNGRLENTGNPCSYNIYPDNLDGCENLLSNVTN